MAVVKRGKFYSVDFWFAGRRIQESAKTSLKTLAQEYERKRRLGLQRAYAGLPVDKPAARVKTVSEYIQGYIANYRRRPKSIAWTQERLAHVDRLLGSVMLVDLTEARIHEYIRTRDQELRVIREKRGGNDDTVASGRTINMELGVLARALGKHWSDLWPGVGHLEERKDTGRALSYDEEQAILEAAGRSKSPTVVTFLRVLLLTAMRCGELSGMTWRQVDFANRTLQVGRAKTSSGTGRLIPMNNELLLLVSHHAEWYKSRFGETRPEWFLFPFGVSQPKDPTLPTLSIKKAWGNLRKVAKVDARLHDLRHTAITKLAETCASDATLMAIVGHMSRAMLEHYSHVRMQAKRRAMEALSTERRPASTEGVPAKVPTVKGKSNSASVV